MNGSESIGWVKLGASYARSADVLSHASPVKASQFGAKPVDFLYSHAIELLLKGWMLAVEPQKKPHEYGHDLLALYDAVRVHPKIGTHLIQIESVVCEKWKDYLRSARDDFRKNFNGLDLLPEQLAEFGVLTNAEIGNALPKLRAQISWLSDRHKDSGGEFRYLRLGVDRREKIIAFGLNKDVVWQSLSWACELLHDSFSQLKIYEKYRSSEPS